jgi:hypothetical protein
VSSARWQAEDAVFPVVLLALFCVWPHLADHRAGRA